MKSTFKTLYTLSICIGVCCLLGFARADSIEPVFQDVVRSDAHWYILRVPESHAHKVRVAIRERLQSLEGFVQSEAEPPVFAINGGFFDPKNHQTISYVVQDGHQALDPTTNSHLTDNQNLKPYLSKIWNRSELRKYQCLCDGANEQAPETYSLFDIVPHQMSVPEGCQVDFALGAGPQLLPHMTDQAEAFTDYDAKGKRTRDPVGIDAKNARSAVGVLEDGGLIIVMAAKLPDAKTASGASLKEVAAFLKEHGAVKAMALDGGSSSGVYYNGHYHYGKFSTEGQPVKRALKSILLLD